MAARRAPWSYLDHEAVFRRDSSPTFHHSSLSHRINAITTRRKVSLTVNAIAPRYWRARQNPHCPDPHDWASPGFAFTSGCFPERELVGPHASEQLSRVFFKYHFYDGSTTQDDHHRNRLFDSSFAECYVRVMELKAHIDDRELPVHRRRPFNHRRPADDRLLVSPLSGAHSTVEARSAVPPRSTHR